VRWWGRRFSQGALPHRPTIDPTETTRAALSAERAVRQQAIAIATASVTSLGNGEPPAT
jgi:hypothetical protein